MRKKTNILFLCIAIMLVIGLVTSCEFGLFGGGGSDTGTVSLALTDAPIVDASNVAGVYITISSIAYNLNDEWIEATNFNGPQEFNLLDLTNGEIAPLADTELPAGTVGQIRFMLDVKEFGKPYDGTPGAYIQFNDDDSQEPLFIPSGSESGVKFTGGFDVPENDTIDVTADFDLRKSLVKTGMSDYILRPTIKLIVNNEAGSISGDFTPPSTTYESYVIFVYENESFDADEATTDPPYKNAVTSTKVENLDEDATLEYAFKFLAEGTYDLLVVGSNSDGTYDELNTDGEGSITSYGDITVTSGTETTQNIDLSS